MHLDDALQQRIAAAVHQAVAALDPVDAGVWRCELYAAIGAQLLQIVTGEKYETVGGFTGVLSADVCLPAHASGKPLAAAPSWVSEVKHLPDPGHAWIENRHAARGLRHRRFGEIAGVELDNLFNARRPGVVAGSLDGVGINVRCDDGRWRFRQDPFPRFGCQRCPLRGLERQEVHEPEIVP